MSRSTTRPRRRHLLLFTLATCAAALTSLPASADVQHSLGYDARVDGDPGWYGSFHLTGIGPVWCVDAALPAPDPEARYKPTTLPWPASTRTALAWLVGRRGFGTSRADHAAVALAVHHLVGARYPSGALNVHLLDAAATRGFGNDAAEVVARARAFVNDALAHGHLRGPLRLALDLPPVGQGGAGRATASVVDAAGRPVAGVPVLFSATGAPLTTPAGVDTDGAGRAAVRFRAGATPVRIAALAAAPDLALQAFAPTTARRQRVVRAAQVGLAAVASTLPTPPPATVTVRKTGDAQPFLGVAGARFEVRAVAGAGLGPVAGTLVTDAAGATGVLRLTPGRYRVTETSPPPGYRVTGPWTIDLAPGQAAVVRAHDEAVRARATVAKVDAITGGFVAGAHLVVAHDADLDGAYETALPPIVTADRPTDRLGLLPGRYRILEVKAPDGYVLDSAPVDVELGPGDVGSVVIENRPAPVAITATKVDAADGTALAGAVYDLYRRLPHPAPLGDLVDAGDDDTPSPPPDAATVPGHLWVGRARSDSDGRLRWPGVRPGAVHCAREVQPPPGYRSDPTLRCTPAPVAAADSPHLLLPDEAVPPPTTATTTTAPPPPAPPTTTPAPPATAPTPAAGPPVLARTGTALGGLALLGAGLLLVGVAAVTSPRRRRG